MKKASVFFAAAAAIMVSSTMTLTTHAAVKAVVIGSNGTVLTGNASLQELLNGLNCENPGISWPDLELPDLNLPGQGTPELPDVDIPGPERPETPDTDQPAGDSGSQNSAVESASPSPPPPAGARMATLLQYSAGNPVVRSMRWEYRFPSYSK